MNKMRTVSLLAISFILTTAYAISPGIPIMMEQFPNQSEASIQFLTTIPALSVTVMVIISSFISSKIGSKKTVMLGLILVSIFGPLPAILNDFNLILISRMILGVGFGLINTFAVSLIGYFFDGDKKASMMGFRSATESIGQSLLTLIAGYLLAFSGWRASFLVYLVAVPILLLFAFNVPDVDLSSEKEDTKGAQKQKHTVNLDVIFFALILFVTLITYVGLKVRLSGVMIDKGYGTVVTAGNILSMLTFIGMFSGVIFGKVYSKLKYNLLPVALFGIAIGEIIVAFSNNAILTGIACALIGLVYPFSIAFIFNLASTIAPKNSDVFAVSILLFGTNVGAAFAPYGLQLVKWITGNSDLAFPFMIYGFILIVLSILTKIRLSGIERKQSQTLEEK